MIVGSLLLILVAVTLLVFGLANGSSTLLISSIAASLLAAVALVVGARQAAARPVVEDDALLADPGALDGRPETVRRPPINPPVVDLDHPHVSDPAGTPADDAYAVSQHADSQRADSPYADAAYADVDAGLAGAADRGPARGEPVHAGAERPPFGSADERAFPPGAKQAISSGDGRPLAADPSDVSGPADPDGVDLDAVRHARAGQATSSHAAPGNGTAGAGAPSQRVDSGGPAGREAVLDQPAPDDPADEPAPQRVSPADAAQLARTTIEVLVVDGRPRYHLAGCPHLTGRQTEPIPVAEAIDLGFTPCGRCRPVDRLVAAPRPV
jgi:hypothetical protein